jgi:hypothetical protein
MAPSTILCRQMTIPLQFWKKIGDLFWKEMKLESIQFHWYQLQMETEEKCHVENKEAK